MTTTQQAVRASVIVAHAITKSFPSSDPKGVPTQVLNGIDVTVNPGEFVAIVGSSGSGKSTLLYTLSGLEAATSGEVELVGSKITGSPEVKLTRTQQNEVGFVFQNYQLLPFLSVRENIMLPAKYAGRTADALVRLPKLLEKLDISDKEESLVAGLSGGQQQRVAIARALINEPSVVFADEPTGALDSKNGREVVTILSTIPNEKRAVVMVTHDMEVASHASRVLILADGRIVKELKKSTAPEILAAVRSIANIQEG